MARGPYLAFSLHPKWLSLTGSAEGFLRPLQEAGMEAVEFTLHPHDPDWAAFPSLIDECQRLGLRCHFHLPYLDPYNIAGFSDEAWESIEALYRPAVSLAQRFTRRNDGPPTLVIHGARGANRTYHQLEQDTVAFMEWLVAQNPQWLVAVENLPRDPAMIKIGTEHWHLIDVSEALAVSRVGICWDMGHDVRLGFTSPPEEEFLQKVIHVHVHDLNARGVDHHPLIYGHVPYRSWLPLLMQRGFEGCITLEVSGYHLGHEGLESVHALLVESLQRLRGCCAVS